MAFVRTKKVNGGEYHQLVESYRDGGRVRQRVLLHLGEIATVDEALRVWPERVDQCRRRAQAHREGARLIRSGEVRASWRTSYLDFRTRPAYLVPSLPDERPRSAEERTLVALLGGSPEGWMYMRSAEEGERDAEDYEHRADALEEKLEKLRRLEAEGKA